MESSFIGMIPTPVHKCSDISCNSDSQFICQTHSLFLCVRCAGSLHSSCNLLGGGSIETIQHLISLCSSLLDSLSSSNISLSLNSLYPDLTSSLSILNSSFNSLLSSFPTSPTPFTLLSFQSQVLAFKSTLDRSYPSIQTALHLLLKPKTSDLPPEFTSNHCKCIKQPYQYREKARILDVIEDCLKEIRSREEIKKEEIKETMVMKEKVYKLLLEIKTKGKDNGNLSLDMSKDLDRRFVQECEELRLQVGLIDRLAIYQMDVRDEILKRFMSECFSDGIRRFVMTHLDKMVPVEFYADCLENVLENVNEEVAFKWIDFESSESFCKILMASRNCK